MAAECWAKSHGGCTGGASAEHIVSRSILGETVTVKGLHWCKAGFRKVGVSSLTCKCLCRHHNSLLSKADQAIQGFLHGVAAIPGLMASNRRGPPAIWHVDGLSLGQWLAKTICNEAASRGGHVPAPLVRYAFSTKDDRAIGVYLALSPAFEMGVDSSHIGMRPVYKDDDPDALAVRFILREVSLIISTLPLEPLWPDMAPMFKFHGPPWPKLLNRTSEIELRNRVGQVRGRLCMHW